jgi:phospholipid/cholesterol/gamma-HCH transport system substrate-binding protein
MKISNETKVGALTIVAVTFLIVGFNYLKGKDVFNTSKKIYAVFNDLGTLEKSNEVKINGLPVGTVYEKKEKDKDISAIVVTINLTRDVNIPKNSVAYIASNVMGSSFIVIERGNSSDMMESGDTLTTRTESGILGDVKAQLNPTLNSVRENLEELKKTLANLNSVLNDQAKLNIQQTIANLNASSEGLKGLLDKENGSLSKTMSNAASITESFKKNSDDISITLQNTRKISDKLEKVDINATVDSLNKLVNALKTTITNLNNGEGTAGAMLQDKKLYEQLNATIMSAEILMDDLRTHPKRYVSISVFGKKDKTTPLNAPTKKGNTTADKK